MSDFPERTRYEFANYELEQKSKKNGKAHDELV
jgi:hypothetical protein